MSTEDRFVDIEIKLAHQEDLVLVGIPDRQHGVAAAVLVRVGVGGGDAPVRPLLLEGVVDVEPEDDDSEQHEREDRED